MITLYHYWRSSSSFRVRWMLNHKRIPHKLEHVHLLKNESHSTTHLHRNPMGQVPVIKLDDGRHLAQSLAIAFYLDDAFSDEGPKIFRGSTAYDRAREVHLAELINSGIQPLHNLGVLNTVSDDPSDEGQRARDAWAAKWIRQGLTAFEKEVTPQSGRYCWGDELGLPDFFLIPQLYTAPRFGVKPEEFPRLHQIFKNALELPSCEKARPEHFQPVE